MICVWLSARTRWRWTKSTMAVPIDQSFFFFLNVRFPFTAEANMRQAKHEWHTQTKTRSRAAADWNANTSDRWFHCTINRNLMWDEIFFCIFYLAFSIRLFTREQRCETDHALMWIAKIVPCERRDDRIPDQRRRKCRLHVSIDAIRRKNNTRLRGRTMWRFKLICGLFYVIHSSTHTHTETHTECIPFYYFIAIWFHQFMFYALTG